MSTMHKPYIFPDENFTSDSVPTPWIDYIEGQPKEKRAYLFAKMFDKGTEWFIANFDALDHEDRKYACKLFYLMGNPLWKNEAMNYFVLMKQHIGG